MGPDILGVAFDMDGLMFDSEPLYHEITRRMLHGRGRSITQALVNASMGLRPREAVAVLRDWHAIGETVDALLAERSRLYSDLLDAYLRPMPGLFDLLSSLDRAGTARCVATSAPRAYAEQALSRWGLSNAFAFVLAAEDVSAGKPDPEIYATAAARLGVEPGRMLVLEDSQIGLLAAKAAGARCVVVPHALNAGQDHARADAVVSSLADPTLLELIGVA